MFPGKFRFIYTVVFICSCIKYYSVEQFFTFERSLIASLAAFESCVISSLSLSISF